jgi:protein gp37
VETTEYLFRLDHLRAIPAKVRFASFEPLLADLGKINFSKIDWAIVGGESGPSSGPVEKSWVIKILNLGKTWGKRMRIPLAHS